MKHDLPQRDCTTLFWCMGCVQARKSSLILPCRGLGVRACGGGMLSRALVLALLAVGTVDALRTQGKSCPAAFQSVGCLRRWQSGPMAPFGARSSVSVTRMMSTKTAEPKVATATGNFDLKRYLAEKKAAVERALDLSVQPTCKEVKKITDSMRYSLLAGGKRIRPIMCIAACEMAGGTQEMAMPTAVALEMIHTMSLIHDDLPSMDNDSLRRGKPTNHVVYGEDVAILAGDALLSTAFEHAAKFTKGVPAERVVDVIARLGTSVGPVGLAGGQVMDLECEGKQGVGLQELTWIHTHKTAALLKVSVAAGAVLAGASKEEVAACEKYAVDIGLAFQVADDILDVTASTEALGKTAGKDLNMDKTTYPKLLGLDGSREEARRLVTEAKSALAVFGARAEPLLAIADYIVDREN